MPLEDAEGKVNGALKVEVFWSHALRPGERPKSPPSGPKPAGAAASAAEPAEALVAPGAAAETAKPNFIVFLTDDQGWGDLGCYGHPELKTPNLDRFASEGLRLTQCYSACAVCSPSRSAILTGRTPYRNGVWRWIPSGSPVHLRTSELTIATLLKTRGYETCHAGKWHLNGHFNSDQQPQPSDHGYDHWLATQNNAAPHHLNPVNYVRNGTPTRAPSRALPPPPVRRRGKCSPFEAPNAAPRKPLYSGPAPRPPGPGAPTQQPPPAAARAGPSLPPDDQIEDAVEVR